MVLALEWPIPCLPGMTPPSPAEQAAGGGVEVAGRGIEKEKESTLSLGSRVENEISKTDETDCAG